MEDQPLVQETPKSSPVVKKLVVVSVLVSLAVSFLIGATAASAITYRAAGATQLSSVEVSLSNHQKRTINGDVTAVWKSKLGRAFVLNRRVVLHAIVSTQVDGSVTVNSMTDKSELHINGNILGKLQVNSMNEGSRIRVSGDVRDGINANSMNGGSQIEVSGTCGQETTAGGLTGGSKITGGSGCEYWDFNDPNMWNNDHWDNDWKHDNDNWSHWDSATGVRVSVACLLAGGAAAAL